MSPLHAAAAKGHSHPMDSIISITKCDADLQTEVGCSALHMAAENGHSKVIETLLVKWNANPKIENNSGHTTLHFSVVNGHKDALQKLLNHKHQLANVQDNDGFTPLHFAMFGSQISFMEPLMKVGANVNIEAAGSLTLFILVIWKHSGDAVQYLIKSGAKLEASDCFGMKCVDWAALKYFTNPALEKKRRHIKPTTPSQRDAVVSRNTSKLAQHLLHSGSRSGSSSTHAPDILGRCLLRAGNTADALLALQLSAITGSSAAIGNSASELTYNATCELCEAEKITGDHDVCKVCPDYGFCVRACECMKLRRRN